MDLLRITKIPAVVCQQGHETSTGTLHLLTHHVLFASNRELWISYSSIQSISLCNPLGQSVVLGPMIITLTTRNFLVVRFTIPSNDDANNCYQSLLRCINITNITNLYAFFTPPSKPRWTSWNVQKEYERQGMGQEWRMVTLNQDYSFSPTYPSEFMVPLGVSDSVLQHAVKFRSKGRLPILSYNHPKNHITISRSSQPLAGIQAKRSYQDEFLVQAIFATGKITQGQINLIVDARPTVNAMAMTVVGAGAESMENYPNCRQSFLGIDNIHVVRDSWNRLLDTITNCPTPIPIRLLDKSGWLKHIRNILDGTLLIVQSIDQLSQHVLVHCSDGWDRTSQLCALAMLCLDPYYRTMEGFGVLVEKEFVSVGHKFITRLGTLSRDGQEKSEDLDQPPEFTTQTLKSQFAQAAKSGISFLRSNLSNSPSKGDVVHSANQNTLQAKEASPIFTQFLDCVHQILTQYPDKFEFTDAYLVQLNTFLYSNHFGNFLFNSEKERKEWRDDHGRSIEEVTCSVWDWFSDNFTMFLNPNYKPDGDRVLFPSTKELEYWQGWLFKSDRKLNGIEQLDIGGDDVDLMSSTASLSTPTPQPILPAGPKESGMETVKNAFAGLMDFNPWASNGTRDGLSNMDSLKSTLPVGEKNVKPLEKPIVEKPPVVEAKPSSQPEKLTEGLFSNLFTPGYKAPIVTTSTTTTPITVKPVEPVVTKVTPPPIPSETKRRDDWHPLLDD